MAWASSHHLPKLKPCGYIELLPTGWGLIIALTRWPRPRLIHACWIQWTTSFSSVMVHKLFILPDAMSPGCGIGKEVQQTTCGNGNVFQLSNSALSLLKDLCPDLCQCPFVTLSILLTPIRLVSKYTCICCPAKPALVNLNTEAQNEEKVVFIPFSLVVWLILGPEQMLVYECFCLLQNVRDSLELALIQTP